MALPPLVPVSELEIAQELAPGALSGATLARAEQDLRRVSALIRAEAGRDWVDVDGVTITAPEDVLAVALEAALRVHKNPDGYSGESLDGYAYTRAQGADVGVGVYLTDAEKAIVRRAAQGRSGPLTGTVRTPSAYTDAVSDERALWGLE